jgi:hypothetical protein
MKNNYAPRSTHLLLAPAGDLTLRTRKWLRSPRNKAKVIAHFRTSDDIRITPIPQTSFIACTRTSTGAGCTLAVREGRLDVYCCPECSWIAQEICGILQKEKLIGKGAAVIDCPKIETRAPKPIQAQGCTTLQRKRRRQVKAESLALTNQRFASVNEAVQEAMHLAGKWLVFPKRALATACESNFVAPDKIHAALLALAKAAELNSENGLGMTWEAYLARAGFDFSPNCSETTLARFPRHYAVEYEKTRYVIKAHVKFGTGTGSESARIYLSMPASKGQPVIIGHIGSHLPISERSH